MGGKTELPPPFLDLEEGLYNCLMAGTPVVLADHSTMLIEDIVRRRLPVDVLAWTREKGIHSARVYDWHRNRVPGQEWLRIRLTRMSKTTRGLVLTPDHEVFVDGGNPTPAALLRAGQMIALLPTVRYKLPRDLQLPQFVPLRAPMLATPVAAEIESVTRYAPKTSTPGERLKAETRFCISVEGAGNFFTSFGLVKNCRDVLGMCRAYKPLCEALVRGNALDVYSVDRQMAFLAKQMTHIGLPIDIAERDRIGTKLMAVRDEAAEKLRQWTEGEHRETFFEWLGMYQAAKARKDDPQAGQINDMGTVHSQESAFLARKEIRKAEFIADIERSALLQQIYDYFVAGGAGTQFELAEHFNVDHKLIGNVLRSWGNKEILIVEKTTETMLLPEDDKPSKRTVYTARLAPAPVADESNPEAVEDHKQTIIDAIGGINYGSKLQQAAILRTAGVPLTKLTEKTGLPKISKDTLEELQFHEAARYVLDWILTSATINNVIEGYTVAADSRVHANWMIHKITGRWGSSPNVQNLSKRAGGGRVNTRTMIVAPEGFIFVGADFAQLEARIIAAASQDPFLLEVFATGQDIHSSLAGVAFPAVWPRLAATFATHKGTACGPNPTDKKSKCEFCKQRDKLRDLTKRLEYGAFYGGTADTLWKSVVKDFPDVTIAQINEFLRVVNQRMPGVLRWRANELAKAEKTFQIQSPILGRRELFPLGRVEPSVAYNYIPQSGGADLWALGAIDFMERWDQFNSDDARICHNGHDSVLILTKECFADRVRKDVEECWTRTWNGVTFTIEAEIGRRWSDT